MPDFIYLLETRLSAGQRSAIQHVRDAAREAGMNLFLAGGAVRDLISGFPVRDLDFSVQGGTSKLKRPLEKAGAVPWGSHAETHTLFYWFPGSARVEISGTRREEYPKPGKPVYHHATMLEDLRRRDFTANAMAISLNEGSYGLLLDPMNGIADIENRYIRLVSSYGFIEDPSRLVRAIRLAARTGWEMDERTRARYENAKEEGVIQFLSPFLRGYELEEIGHEEDALKALRALEAEGWMEHLFPSWTSAKADVAGLGMLHQLYVRFLMQGVHPDLSAAQMRLLTAKMSPKELAGMKKMLPCPGFVEQWEHLDEAAKEFGSKLTAKEMTMPSETWKLIANYQPEPVLWLAYTSKNSAVQAKFHNFFEVWPGARQKIPTQLMAEMRISAELPKYGHLLNELFFALIDGKLETEEAMRAFLGPYSPPAPPPVVTIRRPRKSKAEVRARLLQEEEEEGTGPGAEDEEEDRERDERELEGEEHEEEFEEGEEGQEMVKPLKSVKAAKAVKAAKTSKAGKAVGKEPAKKEEKVAVTTAQAAAAGKAVPAKAVVKKPEAVKPVPKKEAAKAKPEGARKPAAKVPAKPAKAVKKEKAAPAKPATKKPAAKAAKPAAKKPAATKPAVKKSPAKPSAKAAAKKSVVVKKQAPRPAAKKPAPKPAAGKKKR